MSTIVPVAVRLRLLLVLALFGSAIAGCEAPAAVPEKGAGPVPTEAEKQGYSPLVGDVLFQSLPHGYLIDAIEGATHSPFSHCGIVGRSGDRWVVVEANGSVKETELDAWIGQGREKAFAVYRFDDRYQDKLSAMISAARKWLGKPYDMHYDFNDQELYCSELVFKAFKEATGEECGEIVTLGQLDWKPHETVIRFLERGGLPLERRMITPKHLSEGKQLKPVLRKGI